MPSVAVVFALIALTCTQARAFEETFDTNWTLEEAGSMSESASPNWWLNSGGRIVSENGIGRTIEGNLPPNDRWRIAYSRANPLDTADGYRPQNLFRLLTRSRWLDFRAGFYFRI